MRESTLCSRSPVGFLTGAYFLDLIFVVCHFKSLTVEGQMWILPLPQIGLIKETYHLPLRPHWLNVIVYQPKRPTPAHDVHTFESDVMRYDKMCQWGTKASSLDNVVRYCFDKRTRNACKNTAFIRRSPLLWRHFEFCISTQHTCGE